ncbi:MAG: hypothetical protein OEN50_02095, partial [Deltaproteobacteria bacterium]|nr:hypothetical protein [Deltaproteobacteria bacterium]
TQMKNKTAIVPYHDRRTLLQSLRFVDQVIPETSWEQKPLDIWENGVRKFVMGHDWTDRFDYLREYCEVIYLPRTENVSTTQIKELVQRRVLGKVVRFNGNA